ncbi:hypothetical protein OIV83_006567, partial [Microbotryomycetes sp. JL201]
MLDTHSAAPVLDAPAEWYTTALDKLTNFSQNFSASPPLMYEGIPPAPTGGYLDSKERALDNKLKLEARMNKGKVQGNTMADAIGRALADCGTNIADS